MKNKKTIIKYLNENGISNPFNSTLEDSKCYLFLLEDFFTMKFNSSKSPDIRKMRIRQFNDKSEEDNEEKDEEDEEEEAEIDEDNNICDYIILCLLKY